MSKTKCVVLNQISSGHRCISSIAKAGVVVNVVVCDVLAVDVAVDDPEVVSVVMAVEVAVRVPVLVADVVALEVAEVVVVVVPVEVPVEVIVVTVPPPHTQHASVASMPSIEERWSAMLPQAGSHPGPETPSNVQYCANWCAAHVCPLGLAHPGASAQVGSWFISTIAPPPQPQHASNADLPWSESV